MRLEALTSEGRKFFPLLSNFRDDFYLAGGTALALQVGHRLSIDFDLFSDKLIKKTLFKKVEEIFSKLKDHHVLLSEIIDLAQKKYGNLFNDRLFLEQLVYLDDIEEVEVKMIDQSAPSKNELLKLFSQKIKDLEVKR